MEILTNYTDFLRKRYFHNLKQTFIVLIVANVILLTMSVLVDTFFPFTTWFNIIRALIIGVFGIVVFSVGYLISFFLSQAKRNVNDDYVLIKDRFSPTWRRRISIIVGAGLFGIVYSTDKNSVYTFVNSLVIATIIAIVIFLTMSEEEQDREYYGVPDARDSSYENNLKRIRSTRQEKINAKKERKESKRNIINKEKTIEE